MSKMYNIICIIVLLDLFACWPKLLPVCDEETDLQPHVYDPKGDLGNHHLQTPGKGNYALYSVENSRLNLF